MTTRRLIKVGLQIVVPVLLVALLVWRIDFYDTVLLIDGSQIRGRVTEPKKTARMLGEVLLEDEAGVAAFPVDRLRTPDDPRRSLTYGPPDVVRLADGSEARGRIEFPRQGERIVTHVRIKDRDGRDRTVPVDGLSTPDQPGRSIRFGFLSSIGTVARDDAVWWGLGILLMGVLPITTGYRWKVLLDVQGVHLGFWGCVKLTLLGFFLDNVMPGSTGGDLVKAYYAARQAHRKAEAAISVFVDRFVGLFALACLSGAAVLFFLGRPAVARAAIVVAVFLGVVLVAAAIFFSRRIRRLVRFDWIIKRLPFQGIVLRCDEAVFLYRYHKGTVVWAIVLSLVTQASAVLSMYFIGRGMGVRGDAGMVGLYSYFVFFPVVMMLSAIPVSPGGLGWREGLFAGFFGLAGVPAGMGAALGVVYRVGRMLWSLPGALFLWGRKHVSTAEMERELAEPLTDAGGGEPVT